ncbi:MAG TPA: cation:proton antiporter [Candidatus Limnocylindria bacterium]|nr:cation:proton antiporter [Candidatus Limnocylindria bacterium]
MLQQLIADNTWFIAAAWMGLALAASLVSIRLGISVALIEIAFGIFAGNFLGLQTTPWIDFLAAFGSVLLTFLAGAEIEPAALRRHLRPTLAIGTISFLLPFLGVWLFAERVSGWDHRAALIAGIALSTTSVAVVYAVMVETGLNATDLGKVILAACFVTDLGTVLALGVLFASFNGLLVLFAVILALSLVVMPRATRFVVRTLGARVSEPEIKFLFFMLFVLGGFATLAKSEAVLPAYLVGLVVAGVFARDKLLIDRMRSIAFALLTPFYFLKAGLFVSLPAVVAGAGLIVVLLGLKLGTKAIGVWPVTRAFRFTPRDGTYTTLLMSTGLTFGTISALFGLTNKIIDQAQYTILVTVVILSAVVPTLIAQTFFRPETGITEVEEPEAALEPVPSHHRPPAGRPDPLPDTE